MKTYYVEIGTINGYNAYKIVAKNRQEAIIKARQFHVSRGRSLKNVSINVSESNVGK